jgi:transposase
MNHVAIDLGSRKSQLCVRSADGTVIREVKVANADLGLVLGALEGKNRVVVESSSEAFAVADIAKAAGHEVTVVPSTLAPSLGVGQRGIKTDKRDALNLSMALCRMERLPSVHCPSIVAREHRARLTARAALVDARTQLINCVRGLGRTQLVTIRSGKTSTFAERARKALLESPSGVSSHVEHLLKSIEVLTEQIALANEEVKQLAKQDDTCIRLMTVPGVGPITALSFKAAVDDVSRFASAHAVGSYLGLTPRESSSGMRTQRGRITGAGPTRLRSVLVQAAWCGFRKRRNEPAFNWAHAVAERRPRQVAVVALARKLAGILFALWRDGTTYDPAHTNSK